MFSIKGITTIKPLSFSAMPGLVLMIRKIKTKNACFSET
jgi:hypothetical protein